MIYICAPLVFIRHTYKAAPSKKPSGKKKPQSWLKAMPDGCARCRFIPGCTPSCWKKRGGPPK